MRKAALLVIILVICGPSAFTQAARKGMTVTRIPVHISHGGQDATGTQFVAAVKRALTTSEKYRLGDPGKDEQGFHLYAEILTVRSDSKEKKGTSLVSVVVEEMGLPNSWPVPTMWYHKLFDVQGTGADVRAREFLADMDASWCNYIHSSVGNCPRETINAVHR